MRMGTALLSAALTIFAFCPNTQAGTIVTALSTDLGGGLYQYDLVVDNTSGLDPVSGLIVVHGDQVFALDSSSTIGAPSAWFFIPPFPSVTDPLSYIALSIADDVAVGDQLGGFSF